MGNHRNHHSRGVVRKHLAVIVPILVLYFYLVFFAMRDGARYNSSTGVRYIDDDIIFKPQRPDWQNIHHPKYNFSIYSAYSFDSEEAEISEVLVLSAYREFYEQPVKCRFYFANDESTKDKVSVVVQGHIETLPGWDVRFAGNMIKCRLPIESDDINDVEDHPLKKPHMVSILVGNETNSVARLEIQYKTLPKAGIAEEDKNYQFQFAVCPNPIINYDHVFHFLEWMEFYKMMGVQQFTFYDVSSGPHLRCVMRNLPKYDSGITVNVDQWQAYPAQNFSIPTYAHGLSVAANDCLLRHKGVSKYLIFADLNEYIMPSEEMEMKNFADFMELLNSQNTSANYGEYVLRKGFYERGDVSAAERCASLKSNSFAFYVCQELHLMQFDKREGYLSHQALTSTAYIARPEKVVIAGEHHAIEMEDGFDSKKVPEYMAVSRRLRMQLSDERRLRDESVSDQFGVELARKVTQSVDYFMDKCELSLGDLFN